MAQSSTRNGTRAPSSRRLFGLKATDPFIVHTWPEFLSVALPGLPGMPLCCWEEATLDRQARQIVAEVWRLVEAEGIPAGEVAVLAFDSVHKRDAYQALKDQARRRNLAVSVENHAVPDRVLVDTVARFKGLEAAAVVVWFNGTVDLDEDQRLLYVAFSRARSLLALAGTEDACAASLDTHQAVRGGHV